MLNSTLFSLSGQSGLLRKILVPNRFSVGCKNFYFFCVSEDTKANFVQHADFFGRALYKFRTLSMKLLKLSWMHSEQLQEFLDFQPQPYKWIDNFPFDLTFPSTSSSFLPGICKVLAEICLFCKRKL